MSDQHSISAVILAAGKGSRLHNLTRNKPKCLTRVNGIPIIQRQISALLAGGIRDIHIVCGYRADQLKNFVRQAFADTTGIHFVDNKDYASTNNMYSLHLAASYIADRDTILMNADVFFDTSVITDLVAQDGTRICTDVGVYNEESMKVQLAGGRLRAISKTLAQHDSYGCSIDVYKLDAAGANRLLAEVEHTISSGDLNQWTEVAIDRLMKENEIEFLPFDISGRFWFEIDTLDDLCEAEKRLGQREFPWEGISIAFVDMDGTLFRGKDPIPGADSFLACLAKQVPEFFLLSNNSSRGHEEYAAHLRATTGITIDPNRILLSTDALCTFLKDHNITSAYCVGTESFKTVLAKSGCLHTEETPQAVVLAYDTELTYDKLRQAALLLHDRGLPYYATHIDMVCPTEQGYIPDIGAMTALLEAATGRTPDLTFGKPSKAMVEHVINGLHVSPEKTVFVGDRSYTDAAMAREVGARFIGVLSGDSDREDFEDLQNITIFPSVASVFGRDQ